MGILSFLMNRQKNQIISQVKLMTENANHFYLWGGTVYNSDIVRACLRPKVKAIGKLVGKHIRKTLEADGTASSLKVNPDVNIKMLLEEPNPLMSGQVMQEKLAAQLCLNNNAFAVIMRDDMGNPTSIYPIVATDAEAIYLSDGTLTLKFTLPNRNQYTFLYSDVIHLRNDFNENDIFGTPLAPALTPLLDVVTITDQGIISAIKNSGVIKWLLTFSNAMRPEDLKQKSKEFAENYLATSNSTGVAATDAKATAQQINSTDFVPNAAQMTTTKARIYELFNTNAKIVDSTRTENEWNSYFDAEIEPVLAQMNGEYTRKIFSRRERAFGNSICFEASAWDSASLQTKLSLSQMVDRGAMTPNEWRLTFNLAPIDGGDVAIRRLDTGAVNATGTAAN